jgi:hypothetical protein
MPQRGNCRRNMLSLSESGQVLHTIIATALVGDEPRLYTIDLVFSEDRKNCWFRYTRHINQTPPYPPQSAPLLAYGGSGGLYFQFCRCPRWVLASLECIGARGPADRQARAVGVACNDGARRAALCMYLSHLDFIVGRNQ